MASGQNLCSKCLKPSGLLQALQKSHVMSETIKYDLLVHHLLHFQI
uniref:Uncharacterized protein n=1 Tax=Setaria italica TaxID=4555 RepID=K4AP35_SETIT